MRKDRRFLLNFALIVDVFSRKKAKSGFVEFVAKLTITAYVPQRKAVSEDKKIPKGGNKMKTKIKRCRKCKCMMVGGGSLCGRCLSIEDLKKKYQKGE
jgi:hypothetical protein